MNMQTTSRLAKVGARLAAVGQRHRDLEERISEVERRPNPDQFALQRLKREKLRLKDEMHYCEGLLRTMSRSLPA